MKTTYGYDFQYLPKNSPRPIDDGDVVGCNSDDNPLLMLPNVGDYVYISNNKERAKFHGKVKTRLFNYIRISDEHVHCAINIVVEETDDVWDTLIKE
ncbi:TPA: hypothetical protein ACGQS5_001665 [Serratia liquefaciens]